MGGPVLLPKLYNGRNRTFWFVSFDQFFIRGGQLSGFNTLPTARMLQGDFGEWPGAIYDPASTVIGANGAATRTAFPNNIIPTVAPSAAVTVEDAALSSAPRIARPGQQQHRAAEQSAGRSAHHGFKFDHSLNGNHRLSGMYNSTDRPSNKSPAPLAPDSDRQHDWRSTNYNFQDVTTIVSRINYDWTVSPTLLNHIGVGFSDFAIRTSRSASTRAGLQPNGGKLGLTGLQFDLFPTAIISNARLHALRGRYRLRQLLQHDNLPGQR